MCIEYVLSLVRCPHDTFSRKKYTFIDKVGYAVYLKKIKNVQGRN